MISRDDIGDLTEVAAVALAARCARRIQSRYSPRFPTPNANPVHAAISFAEFWIASPRKYFPGAIEAMIRRLDDAVGAEYRSFEEDFDTAYEDVGELARVGFESATRFRESGRAAEAAKAVLTSITSVLINDHDQLAFDVGSTCQAAEDLGASPDEITSDFEILRACHARGRQSGDMLIPSDFFAVRSRFHIEDRAHGTPVIEIASAVDARLIGLMARDPSRLYLLSPRGFEKVVAELLDGLGYDVQLTARTRDGGFDVVATVYREFRTRFLLECKRYAPDRRVSVGAVRQLHGVVEHEDATKGVLVTTSTFSDPATAFLDAHPWRLEGRDYNGLIEWLQEYQKRQLGFCS